MPLGHIRHCAFSDKVSFGLSDQEIPARLIKEHSIRRLECPEHRDDGGKPQSCAQMRYLKCNIWLVVTNSTQAKRNTLAPIDSRGAACGRIVITRRVSVLPLMLVHYLVDRRPVDANGSAIRPPLPDLGAATTHLRAMREPR